MQHYSLSNLPPSYWRWLGPIPACCLLQSLFGLLYASGVYIALIDDPVFTFAIGLTGLCTAVGITLCGIAMNRILPSFNISNPPRIIALLGTAGLVSQLTIAQSLITKNKFLLFTSCSTFGLGLGALYVASIDVLQAWVPEAPGVVTGLGMLCGGAGSLIALEALRILTHLLNGPIPTLVFIAPISAAAAFTAAMLIKRPPEQWSPSNEDNSPQLADEAQHLLPYHNMITCPSVRVSDILKDPAFYAVVIAFAASVGPGFGFVLAFQRMVHDMFGVSVDKANQLFFWVTLVGVVGRLLSGLAVDWLSGEREEDEDHDEIDMRGARRTNMALLIAQMIAVICMPFCVRLGWLSLFTVMTGVVYLTFSGGAVVAACMARVAFGTKNASLTFSLIGVSIGFGDLFFSWIVALCGKFSMEQNNVVEDSLKYRAKDYDLFFVLGLVWTIAGIGATAVVDVSNRIKTFRKNVNFISHGTAADERGDLKLGSEPLDLSL